MIDLQRIAIGLVLMAAMAALFYFAPAWVGPALFWILAAVGGVAAGWLFGYVALRLWRGRR